MVGENPLNQKNKHLLLDGDIVCSSREILEKFIRELYRLTTYMNTKTISYGGILFCRVVGINMDYTMSISLLILKLLAADSTNHRGHLYSNI